MADLSYMWLFGRKVQTPVCLAYGLLQLQFAVCGAILVMGFKLLTSTKTL